MRLFGATLASAALAVALPSVSRTISSTPSSTPSGATEPCAVVGRLLESSDTGFIPAESAYKCLKSVPVAIKDDEELIDELKLLWGWHSETGWLKNPPSTWELGPLDLIGELDKIKNSLGSYDSEYDVQMAIYRLTVRTGNYHFNYWPDILQVFGFQRLVGVATVSEDGTSVPKTYVSQDLIAQEDDNDIDISPIKSINGQDVQKYLQWVADESQYINADARYNQATYKGRNSQNTFTVQESYQDAFTNLTFANGTTRHLINVAATDQNFTGIASGKDFFQSFCTGDISSYEVYSESMKKGDNGYKKTAPRRRWTKRQVIPSNDYPEPIVEHSEGAVAGYFLTESGLTDVAVLKIITFDPEESTYKEFQSVIRRFLEKCTRANKKKLIIDLRENGGGETALLLDAFMQLFPDKEPFSAQRYRAQEQFKLIGEAVDAIWTNKTALKWVEDETSLFISSGASLRYWSYWNFVNANDKTFASWDSFYGPHEYNDDEFSSIVRYNLSNSNPNSILPANFTFTESSSKKASFAADDIIMFTDGLCGSSCASFHEELKNIAGIKAVTVGGRARSGPMQTIGGTKGGEVIPLSSVSDDIPELLNATVQLGIADLDQSSIHRLIDTEQVFLRVGDSGSRVQVQDQIRKGDSSETPLQYIYEAADCRIWYTAKTLFYPEQAWAAAWNAHTNHTKCVENSTDQSSSLSGGYKAYGSGSLKGEMDQGEDGNDSDSAGKTNAATTWRPSLVYVSGLAVLMGLML
ncbi:hypothetical protein P170DRAFT_363387 [Aspergillus steynii IBT 23096]|uniref:Uncharacterized protein n=1 Tax=Aspergillus steynii IBT 23096 TaxID=1392250 RepID=A0A2I2G1Z0_9EURO|nr:uncharacterized protein P170DRAFT_363387 [Aspergillus steynii IBT 23096]PLB46888.1 hypothetical protein P170DRAFT_363387 [Aspergillus steynii IBT 23096]